MTDALLKSPPNIIFHLILLGGASSVKPVRFSRVPWHLLLDLNLDMVKYHDLPRERSARADINQRKTLS